MLSPVFENILILFYMSLMYCEINEIIIKKKSILLFKAMLLVSAVNILQVLFGAALIA